MMRKFCKYKAVQCPNCGTVRGIQANNAFKCFGCNKNYQLVKKADGKNPTMLNVKILRHSDNPREISEYVRERNAKKIK